MVNLVPHESPVSFVKLKSCMSLKVGDPDYKSFWIHNIVIFFILIVDKIYTFFTTAFVAVFGSGIRDPGSGMGKNQDPG